MSIEKFYLTKKNLMHEKIYGRLKAVTQKR